MKNITITKQQVLQGIVMALAVCGAIAGLAPYVTTLPQKYQAIGLSVVAVAVALEKVLISANQILVGPTKLQTPATQAKLAALPDQSAAVADDSKPTLDPSKNLSSTTPPESIIK